MSMFLSGCLFHPLSWGDVQGLNDKKKNNTNTHKIDILNLEGYQNLTIGSNVRAVMPDRTNLMFIVVELAGGG